MEKLTELLLYLASYNLLFEEGLLFWLFALALIFVIVGLFDIGFLIFGSFVSIVFFLLIIADIYYTVAYKSPVEEYKYCCQVYDCDY